MFGLNTNGLEISKKGLESLMTSNPEMREKLTDDIRTLLWQARDRLALDVKAMYGGERESWRAVRNIVYRKVLGGDLNIKNMKRGTANWRVVQKVRKVEQNPHMRGGNRRYQSLRSARLEGYEGKARGFILRFQNEGTGDRYNKPVPTHRLRTFKRKPKPSGKRAFRGRITGADFFVSNAKKELGIMAVELEKLIDKEMENMYNETTNK